MKFSIVIPAYNAGATLWQCVNSAVGQHDCEIIVVNDGSKDNAAFWLSVSSPSVRVLTHETNQGPGPARNTGIAAASGDWVIFLDSDDQLAPNALENLAAFIDAQPADLDLVGFNRKPHTRLLDGPRAELLSMYASGRMNGAVTFSAVRSYIARGIEFTNGYHEDIAWLYHAYAAARRTACLPAMLYLKGPDGLTSTVTERHLDGYVSAWQDIEAVHAQLPDAGVVAIVATRVREIITKAPTAEVNSLLRYFYAMLPGQWLQRCLDTSLNTQYAHAAKVFCRRYLDSDISNFRQTWGCKDLAHSAYLGPSEVRACCKRFFVGGEQRGDVVLLKQPAEFTPETILAAKLKLLDSINAGEETSCSGCPWLEFKNWTKPAAKVSYLSMEQHSVCNLKCSYCSETYYGGQKPSYDVPKLARALVKNGGTVVWGGGEPTVSPVFDLLAPVFSRRGMTQRVLSNSVKFNHALSRLLADEKVELVTSIDAGTEETFAKIRGAYKLNSVLANLHSYAFVGGSRVVVKYILTEGNTSNEELAAFVINLGKLVKVCSFQISCDFRNEQASTEELKAMIFLFNALKDAGARCIFLDDLAQIRIASLRGLTMAGVADPADYAAVQLYGSGESADRLRAESAFMRSVEIKCKKGLPIIIAASQRYPALYRELCAKGLEEYIMKEFIL